MPADVGLAPAGRPLSGGHFSKMPYGRPTASVTRTDPGWWIPVVFDGPVSGNRDAHAGSSVGIRPTNVCRARRDPERNC